MLYLESQTLLQAACNGSCLELGLVQVVKQFLIVKQASLKTAASCMPSACNQRNHNHSKAYGLGLMHLAATIQTSMLHHYHRKLQCQLTSHAAGSSVSCGLAHATQPCCVNTLFLHLQEEVPTLTEATTQTLHRPCDKFKLASIAAEKGRFEATDQQALIAPSVVVCSCAYLRGSK